MNDMESQNSEQPPAEQPHCLQRMADLYAAADDMAEWGLAHPVVTRDGDRITRDAEVRDCRTEETGA